MSNPKSATATKARAEKSPERLQIECDVAREIISQYLAISAKEAAAEKRTDSPEPERIRVIEARICELYKEQMEIGIDTPELIKKAYDFYAQKVKDAQ